MWRDEDEAFLGRLEDELLFERMWLAEVGQARDEGVRAPPRRAAGMIPLLCARPGGREARLSALRGDFTGMRALAAPARLAGYPPALLHHLALHHTRLARAFGRSGERARAEREHVHALAAWVALTEERSYLLALAGAVAGAALTPGELERVALSMPEDAVSALGEAAREGARDLAPRAAAALAALGRVGEACAIAGAAPATAKTMATRAERARSGAVEEALGPVREAIAEASASGTLSAIGAALFGRFAEVWRWANGDEAVERAATQEIMALLWDHYRKGNWDALRELLRSIEPLVDRFAQRIVSDPSRVAYSAPCAQLLVFRAEAASGEDVQLATLEWALRVCATHRNGRLVLAGLLCDRAIRSITKASFLDKDSATRAAAADVARAELLYPQAKRLAEAREKLAAAKGAQR